MCLACPHCFSATTKRAGHDRKGRQRHFCHTCKREWSHGAQTKPTRESKPHTVRIWPKLLCYHCGSTRCDPLRRRKRSGVQAKCCACGRNFTQGGPEDLRRYTVCLRARIRAAGYQGEMAEEVLADAICDVLSGEAYCWNVKLKKPTLQASGRGDWGKGSDHPAMLAARGIKDEW